MNKVMIRNILRQFKINPSPYNVEYYNFLSKNLITVDDGLYSFWQRKKPKPTDITIAIYDKTLKKEFDLYYFEKQLMYILK